MPSQGRLQSWLQDLSIRYKLQFAILGTTTIAILMALLALALVQWQSASESTRRDLEALAQVMAANSTAAISFNDVNAAEETLSALRVRPDVIVACLYRLSSERMVPFAMYRPRNSSNSCDAQLLEQARIAGQFRGQATVRLNREVLGELLILETDAELWAVTRRNTMAASFILLVCLLAALLISGRVQALISKPILQLSGMASQISESQDFSLRAPQAGKDEIGALVDAFNTMLAQIESAEQRLRELNLDLEDQVAERTQANLKLQETLNQLHRATDQLVQTEKMASLGGLVAGVAHEINTPVGIGVTAASTLNARSREIKQEYADEALTEEGLNAYLELAEQSSTMILSNLERASNLIQSFKQVAVDQTNLEQRRFNVHDYVEEILLSLRPSLRKTKVQVLLECPEDLNIDSFPGPFSQVLTNLVMNALIHAFEPDKEGHIRMRFAPTEDGLLLEFSDDGRGIPVENQHRIFDPFFTTRRGEGGSGLGLHIVYNLVTQQLGGEIRMLSRPGIGTMFFIQIKSKIHVQARTIARTG